ncbi:MAG: hypothetical protein ABJE47_22485 [bacterium]
MSAIEYAQDAAKAEVLGLERNLTVPSRRNGNQLDHWISVSWLDRNDVWLNMFADVAANSCTGKIAAAFEIVSFTPQRGWIVARGVDPHLASCMEVEQRIRALVEDTNLRLHQASAAVSPAPVPSQFSVRVLAALVRLTSRGETQRTVISPRWPHLRTAGR